MFSTTKQQTNNFNSPFQQVLDSCSWEEINEQSSIPEECLSFLDTKSLVRVETVCKKIHALSCKICILRASSKGERHRLYPKQFKAEIEAERRQIKIVSLFPQTVRRFAHPGILCKIETPTQAAQFKKQFQSRVLEIQEEIGKSMQSILASPLPKNLSRIQQLAIEILNTECQTADQASEKIMTLASQEALREIYTYTEEGEEHLPPFFEDQSRYNTTLDYIETHYMHTPICSLSTEGFNQLLKNIHKMLFSKLHPVCGNSRGVFRDREMVMLRMEALGNEETGRLYFQKNDPEALPYFKMITEQRQKGGDLATLIQTNKRSSPLVQFIHKYYKILLPPTKIQGELNQLFKELQRGWSTGDALRTACLAHQGLIHIHPFADGNGTVARTVENMLLMQGGYPPIAFASNKSYTEAVRAEEEGEKGAFENFVWPLACRHSLTVAKQLQEVLKTHNKT